MKLKIVLILFFSMFLLIEVDVVSAQMSDGVHQEFYDSGKLKREQTYKEGMLNGVEKSYYPTGELWAERYYEDGELVGPEKTYYKSGALELDQTRKKGGGFIGIKSYYYENGNLYTQEEISEQGKIVKVTIYKDNGEIDIIANTPDKIEALVKEIESKRDTSINHD